MALPHLRKLLALTGEDEVNQNRLAGVYRRLGEYDRAITLLKRWIQRDGANSITYFNLAACYAQQGDAEAAVDVMRHAVKNFGTAYVQGWMANEELAAIRETPAFNVLAQELQGRAAESPDEGVVMAPEDADHPEGFPPTAAN
jgi:tetratricopeptide (TPR) repeat protein